MISNQLADEQQDSVMLALLPMTTDWCQIELPHMTLVYAGLVADHKPSDFNSLAKDAASIAMLSSPITLRVTGVEQFGDVDKVDVFRLQASSELLAMRNMVDSWNASQFPFNPHVTIGPVGSLVDIQPRYMAFDRIIAAWGTELLTFWLRR